MIRGKDRKKTWSTFEVSRALGIKRITLQDWISRGYIQPGVQSRGPGTKNEFSIHDLYALELFRTLIRRGVSREEARRRANKFLLLEIGATLSEKLQHDPAIYKDKSHAIMLMITMIGDSYNAEWLFGKGLLSVEDLSAYEEVHLINFSSIMEKVDKAF